jgi:ABC-type taurine transport system ATPase subunit
MFIERIQIEEGFLDGFDLTLVPGLNVVIGARGTGKTSLIELVRYCLGVRGYTTDSERRSRDHALSVLGTGQITVTIADGDHKMAVTRSGIDDAPRTSGPFLPPIVFSQTEIESVGLQAGGRLRLLDGFTGDRRKADAEEIQAISDVRSLTSEAEALRREIDELAKQVEQVPAIDKQLADLAPQEQGVAKISSEAAEKKKKLDALSISMASASVATAATDRFKLAVSRWAVLLRSAVSAVPKVEPWPKESGNDPLTGIRKRVAQAQTHLSSALQELTQAENELTTIAASSTTQKIGFEEQARQLRKEIEALQTGAGNVVRQGQQLREQKAQLLSLKNLLGERSKTLTELVKRRGAALDKLEGTRQQRFKERSEAAKLLNKALGPRIRVTVTRAGQYETLSAAVAEALRGSGLRYADLSVALAEHISPRELLEAADANDFEMIAEAAGISKDRAARVLSHLKDTDLGALATIAVEDTVEFQLLDGTDYKDISELSTGQRCTVILPIVLRHTERMLIVDQPEDHIDNAFIVDTLIRSVLSRSAEGQIVFSTHNANIPVLGNAERVVQLGSDGKRGYVVVADSLDRLAVVSAISTIMEGGSEAFERRAQFYSGHKKK